MRDKTGTRIYARGRRDADHGFDKYYLPAYRHMVHELSDGHLQSLLCNTTVAQL